MRDSTGKFVLKNGEYRSVRSLRLTDKTWERLGQLAEDRGITRADLIEEIADQIPGNTPLEQPSNTRLVELWRIVKDWQEKVLAGATGYKYRSNAHLDKALRELDLTEYYTEK